MFDLGKVSVSDGARSALADSGQGPDEFVERHHRGDWGDVSEETVQKNRSGLEKGGRIESVYHTTHGEKLLVVTEPDRSLTSIVLPREF